MKHNAAVLRIVERRLKAKLVPALTEWITTATAARTVLIQTAQEIQLALACLWEHLAQLTAIAAALSVEASRAAKLVNKAGEFGTVLPDSIPSRRAK
jgi:hypothetical protein